MGRLAQRNLARFFYDQQNASPQINLTRGVSQSLPFSDESFDTIVATFPSEYIFDSKTVHEAQRVLVVEGRFVILPGTSLLGRGILDRLMALVFRITGETPPNLPEMIRERTKQSFGKAGFRTEVHVLNIRSSLVFVIVATKPPA
jgi:ubiquinone/menaquinone biosynthesis C-methylase UbiE